ncbi:ABC transporter ATP-binding protein [Clostridium sediminicola]|uniref:ABC transporter ATP-binding protein n=1 Tax=Clostridium sediminicola TaxID=3114879 RepID=UPI0031F27CAD
MENILEINDLRKVYDGFTLKNISFDVKKGYIMGFIGPNGAGKSTTIKLIMNLIKRDCGNIKLFGLDNMKDERAIKDRIGFVYDESRFYENFSIKRMSSMIAPFYSKWNQFTFEKYLKDFDLDPKKKIKDLSKGMKTKFSLAIALSHDAEFIIMDEPTSGLDPVFRREILEILHSIIEDENKSIFFSTHITSDLDKVADYITFINNGEIIFSQEKDIVMDNYGLVKGGLELLNEKTNKNFVGIRKNSFGFEALTPNKREIRKIFRDNILIEKPTLEDIMVYSVRR